MDISRLTSAALAAFVVASSHASATAATRSDHAPAPAAARVSNDTALSLFDALPLRFEPNVGQTDGRVRFLARGQGYALFLTADGVTLSLGGARRTEDADATTPREAIRLSLAGARRDARFEPEDALPGTTNYLKGADSEGWRRDVPTYGAVRCADVYEGIDAVYYGNQRQLEYDLEVAPGADPSQIRIQYEGQVSAEVDETGDLVLRMRSGAVRQLRAAVYQEDGATRRPVASRYRLWGNGEIGVELADYDRARPLVVDPILVYADYLGGGAAADAATAIAVDATGAAYVTGTTAATDFPVTAGAFDTSLDGFESAFVAKLSPNGTAIVYATYLGQAKARAIAVDATGAAIVAGRVAVPAYPTTSGAYDTSFNGGFADAFVAKLSPSGSSLVFSTFLGGGADDGAEDVAVDASGAVYVTGTTESSDFPVTAGAFDTSYNYYRDMFVTKLSPSGSSLAYSAYLGGAGNDTSRAIRVDPAGNAFVEGVAISSDFPKTPGVYTSPATFGVSVTKVNPGGSALVFSLVLGGEAIEEAKGLAVDGSGAVYVAGYTTSDFPTTPNALDGQLDGYQDGFVAKLSNDGSTLVYSTYLGGSDYDYAYALTLDTQGRVCVSGSTLSTDFPVTAGAYAVTAPGNTDAFVSVLDLSTGTLAYSTYLGGAQGEVANAIAAGPGGTVYVAGKTSSLAFPVVNGPSQSSPDFNAAFVAKLPASGSLLLYSATLGGVNGYGVEAGDVPGGIAVDASGAVYVAGSTENPNFPTTVGAYDPTFGSGQNYDSSDDQWDAFVAKVSPDGTSLVFSTYLGGYGNDYGAGVAVDASGAVYVTGQTGFTSTFPTTPGAFDTTYNGIIDAFVTKLAPDGASLVYSTYLGGGLQDEGVAIRVDATGAAYVAGTTRVAPSHARFPTTPGSFTPNEYTGPAEDVFVTKLSPSGASLAYSCFFGGYDTEYCYDLAVDAQGRACVVGKTFATDFPTTPNAIDPVKSTSYEEGFVAQLETDASKLVFGTYLGGEGYDSVASVAADASGAIYVTGTTRSPDFPVTSGAFASTLPDPYGSHVFVTKIVSGGSALAYSSVIGGDYAENAYGIAVDATGAALVTGETTSSDFPTTPNALDRTLFVDDPGHTSDDAFFLKLAADGSSLEYSTYLGDRYGDVGSRVAVDASGDAYVLGWTSYLASTGFGIGDTLSVFIAKLHAPVGDSVALYVGATAAWFLKNTNGGGPANVVFTFGPAGSVIPLRGDWDGDGVDTPGLYVPQTGAFFLRNANGPGPADVTFGFGPPNAGWMPLAGDWDGDGTDTIGFYAPATGVFFLKNSNAPGAADVVFGYGPASAGLVAVTGDFDGDGTDTIGLYAPATGSFFLRNANSPGPADSVFGFGPGGAGLVPLVGDWNGDGIDTIGLYNPSAGAFFLKNANSPGPANAVFGYGPPGVTPLTGNWDGL